LICAEGGGAIADGIKGNIGLQELKLGFFD